LATIFRRLPEMGAVFNLLIKNAFSPELFKFMALGIKH